MAGTEEAHPLKAVASLFSIRAGRRRVSLTLGGLSRTACALGPTTRFGLSEHNSDRVMRRTIRTMHSFGNIRSMASRLALIFRARRSLRGSLQEMPVYGRG